MGLEKSDMIIGLAGIALLFFIYIQWTDTIWDDFFFLIVLTLIVLGVIALSGGLTGLL